MTRGVLQVIWFESPRRTHRSVWGEGGGVVVCDLVGEESIALGGESELGCGIPLDWMR